MVAEGKSFTIISSNFVPKSYCAAYQHFATINGSALFQKVFMYEYCLFDFEQQHKGWQPSVAALTLISGKEIFNRQQCGNRLPVRQVR